ncbi:MAG: NifB/NifX family molybdenum-iron cluster-binding protein [Bacteroidota bacterium]|nr:NifB/NifX family molybdenum-iron cluster-binding protein [Bacteroidota bacterium]
MKIAFATDNGENYVDRHFGDAQYYDVYELLESEHKFIKRISNTTEEDDEEVHADPVKAKGVASLFKDEDIQVLVSKVFGPNIKRIKKKFVCVLMNDNTIKDSIEILQKKLNHLSIEWEKGKKRKHLNFKV